VKPFFPYEFEAVIEHHDLGTMRYTVVFLPSDIAQSLPFTNAPRLRVSGEIESHPFTGAWQPVRGRWYLMLGKTLLRTTGLSVGAFALVRFRVERQEEVNVPQMLITAIRADPQSHDRWTGLTPGKQRALAHRVSSAKTEDTASRRCAEVLEWLRTGRTDLRQLGKPTAPH